MPVPSRITDLSATASDNSPSGTDTVGPNLDDYLRAIQSVIRGDLATKGADIASASTADLGAVKGLFHDITGTTTITSFGTVAAGVWKVLKFEGALTLTHNATSLILLGGENITTADGDVCMVVSEGSGNWRMVGYWPVAINPAKTVSTDETQTLTNKTVNLSSNTLTGTTAQFNTSLSDGDFATLAGSETLTNKTFTNPTINAATISGTIAGAATFSGALTLSSALTYGGVTLSNSVTGTGSMVLATSPTITTPTVSGLLTLNGGGATSDFLALSSASTGTGANYGRFINTGGTYQFGIENSGNSFWGIGAYNFGVVVPASRKFVVQVAGTGNMLETSASGTTLSGTTTAGAINSSGSLSVTGSGTFGGAAISAWGSVLPTALAIGSGISSQTALTTYNSASVATGFLTNNAYYDGAWKAQLNKPAVVMELNGDTGDYIWSRAPANGAGGTLTLSEVMRVTSTGINSTVIGATTPAAGSFTTLSATSTITTGAPTGGAGAWKLGIANSVSPTSPNRTITIDIGGTTYYLAAKTTND